MSGYHPPPDFERPRSRPSERAVDKVLEVRNIVVLGLSIASLMSLAAVASGILCLHIEISRGEGPKLTLSGPVKEIVPLLINVLVTLVNESMGSIHATVLTWSLQYEHRLVYRSNLRLLTQSHCSKANSWYSNAIFLLCVVLSYATPSMIFLGWNPELATVLDVEYQGANVAATGW
jgi:hypothetical protein